MNNRYKSINTLLRDRFGQRVYKVSLEAGLGCPNRDGNKGLEGCTFCNQDALRPSTAIGSGLAPAGIARQLDEGIDYLRRRHGSELAIAYFQNGSNTYAAVPALAPLFEEAISHPSVVGLAVSTRPDCVTDDHIELFKALSGRTMLWVELGLQSAHDETLARINRGHAVSEFRSACGRLSAAGIPVCAHVILGLPGETAMMMRDTARFLNETRVWGVKIHNLHVLKDTRLEEEFRRGEIYIPSLREYAGWVVDFLEELSPDIVVHRFNGHSPRQLTVAPEWSINKLATLNEVHGELARRDSRQGKRFSGTPSTAL